MRVANPALALSVVVPLIALLVAVLLGVIAALVWQEARSRRQTPDPAYVVEDAIGHIAERLEPEFGLDRSDIRRIIEWEVFQLQGLAERTPDPIDVVAGGTPQTVAYIVDRIADEHGVTYAPEQVQGVLELEADYLHAIGVIGDPVETSAPRLEPADRQEQNRDEGTGHREGDRR